MTSKASIPGTCSAASPLDDLNGIRHAFFTRQGGLSDGLYTSLNAGLGSADVTETVVHNRAAMARHLGVEPERLVTPYQVHSPDVVAVDGQWVGERPKADGIVTTTRGLAVGIVTADCGPVLFADTQNGVVGAAHAGWKGALGGVMEATIDEMVRLGAQKSSISAVLGPTISQTNYEVGPDFPRPFVERDADAERYFEPSSKSGHHMFDLHAYIVDRLIAAGVQASTLGVCTYADEERYFSYRRTTHRNEPDYGRQLSAICIC